MMKESFSDVATLVTIYIAEAHSADEWKLDENDNIGVCYLQVFSFFELFSVTIDYLSLFLAKNIKSKSINCQEVCRRL